MKIRGNGNHVDQIRISHKGKGVVFECRTKPLPYEKVMDLEEPDLVKIEFDDLTEVDSMIEMLEIFKKECRGYIGKWKQNERTIGRCIP